MLDGIEGLPADIVNTLNTGKNLQQEITKPLTEQQPETVDEGVNAEVEIESEETEAPEQPAELGRVDPESKSRAKKTYDKYKEAAENYTTLEHKFKTLTGDYNRNVVEVRRENKRLTAEIQELKETLSELKKRSDKEVVEKEESSFNESFAKLKDEHGEELLRYIASFADRVADKKVREYLDPIKSELSTVREHAVRTSESSFLDRVRMHTKLDELNKDQYFLVWCDNEFDATTGLTPRQKFELAQQQGNVERAIAVINSYPQSKPIAVPVKEQDASAMEKLVSPGKSRGSNAVREEPKVTLEDFRKATDRMSRGMMPFEDYEKMKTAFYKQSKVA